MINDIISNLLPKMPKKLVYVFAQKYIAGETLQDAVNKTEELLAKRGAMTTIDVLGEFVDDKERAMRERDASEKVLNAIDENYLPSYLSVKPTSLGLAIDYDFAYENIEYLVKKAAKEGIFVRLDMENSPYTTDTLEIYKRLRKKGFDNVGVVLQAYMRRSENDLKSLLDYKPNIRLCKGIYREPEEIAFQKPDEIRRNYQRLLKIIMRNRLYVGIATHDESLINFARSLVKIEKYDKLDYEFQMLLGVREKRRDELLEEGRRLRVYVPFGKDWFGYSVRRLKENPAMTGNIVKSIFFKG